MFPCEGRDPDAAKQWFPAALAPASAGELARQPIQAAEDGEAQAVVEHVPLADQLAVLVDLLDITLHRAGEERVGEPLPRDAQRGVPGGGEHRAAAAGGVSAGNAHARGVARLGDDGRLGERFAEDRHLFAGPAVVADGGEGGSARRLRFMCSAVHEPHWNTKQGL
jgi:hypothetical protein